ncbi:hypothetical protein GCM10027610_109040 [Dactylosporangium cerinum]
MGPTRTALINQTRPGPNKRRDLSRYAAALKGRSPPLDSVGGGEIALTAPYFPRFGSPAWSPNSMPNPA